MKNLGLLLLLGLLVAFIGCPNDNLSHCDYIVEDDILIPGVEGKFQLLKKSHHSIPLPCQYQFRAQRDDGSRKVIHNFGRDEFVKYEVIRDSLYLYARPDDTSAVMFIRYGLDEL